jgi:antitoxin (DNA-binding transcriptional repressor) of toxin-antitoxin stability system
MSTKINLKDFKNYGAMEGRTQFSRLLDEVYYKKEEFIFKKHEKPMAMLVPIEEYLKLKYPGQS